MDQIESRAETRPSFVGRLAASALKDSRDTQYLIVLGQCLLVAILAVSLFFSSGTLFWVVAGVYAVAWFSTVDRYTLMLHFGLHRRAFDKKALNTFVFNFFGVFFGQTPFTYSAHHLGMHHRESNGADDLSSTLHYRRDSFAHWLHYWLSFLTSIVVTLPRYHLKRGRRTIGLVAFFGEVGYLASALLLAQVNAPAAIITMVAPFFIMRALMMAGNWGQHAFIQKDKPLDDLASVTTCLAERYNRRCFNDGYHAEHHRYAARHWSELSTGFDPEEYGKADATVFSDLDFFGVWVCLMLKRWDRLARSFMRLPGAPERTHEEVVALLKERTRCVVSG